MYAIAELKKITQNEHHKYIFNEAPDPQTLNNQ
jgi:hypothetical protein